MYCRSYLLWSPGINIAAYQHQRTERKCGAEESEEGLPLVLNWRLSWGRSLTASESADEYGRGDVFSVLIGFLTSRYDCIFHLTEYYLVVMAEELVDFSLPAR